MIGFGILISEIVKSKEVCDASIPLLASQPQGIRSSIHSFYAVLLASPLLLLTRSKQWQRLAAKLFNRSHESHKWWIKSMYHRILNINSKRLQNLLYFLRILKEWLLDSIGLKRILFLVLHHSLPNSSSLPPPWFSTLVSLSLPYPPSSFPPYPPSFRDFIFFKLWALCPLSNRAGLRANFICFVHLKLIFWCGFLLIILVGISVHFLCKGIVTIFTGFS